MSLLTLTTLTLLIVCCAPQLTLAQGCEGPSITSSNGYCNNGGKLLAATTGIIPAFINVGLMPSMHNKLTITPFVPFDSSQNRFPIRKSGQYTVQYSCVSDNSTHTTNIQVTVPEVTLKSKCLGTLVDFSFTENCTTLQVNEKTVNNYVNGDVVQIFPPGYGQVHVTCTDDSGRTVCNLNTAYAQPTLGTRPDIVVQPSYCSYSNGSIQVTNPDKFTNLTLSLGGTALNATKTGLWEHLRESSDSTYVLDAWSADCDHQFFEIIVTPSLPQLVVTPLDTNKCPNDYHVRLSLLGAKGNTTWTVNGVSTTNDTFKINPFGITPNSINYRQLDGDQCEWSSEASINIDIPPFLNELTYTINNTNECIDGTGIVTLSMPATSVMIVNNNIPPSPLDNRRLLGRTQLKDSPVVFLDTNQTMFMVTYGQTYKVYTSCTNTPYTIQPMHPAPILVETPYNPNHTSCFYDTSFTIPNYLDFGDIQLATVIVMPRLAGVPPTIYKAVNGVFSNIPRGTYSLTYTFLSANGSTCPFNQTITGLNFMYTKPVLSDLHYTFNYNPLQVCGQEINVTASVTTPTNATATVFTFSMGSGGSFVQEFNRPDSPTCFIALPGVAPVGKMSVPTITITNATCLYNADATFTVTPAPQLCYLNGVLISGSATADNTTYFGQLPGVYNLTIVDSNHGCSWTNEQFTIPQSMPDFKFEYTVTKYITNCSIRDYATINIKNAANYTSFSPAVDTTTGDCNLTSTGAFHFTNGACTHTVSLQDEITKPTGLVLSVTKLHPVTCSQGDGTYLFSATQDGQNLNTFIPIFESNIAQFVKPGNTTFTVSAGTCYFSYTLVTQLEPPNFKFETTTIYPDMNIAGIIDVKTNNPDVFINSLVPSNGDQTYADALNPNRLATSTENVTFTINWNVVCNQLVDLNLPLYVSPRPQYYFKVVGCPASLTFVLVNFDQFIGVTLNGVPLGADGTIPNVPYEESRDLSLVFSSRMFYTNNGIVGPIEVRTVVIPQMTVGSLTEETCTGSYNGQLSQLPTTSFYQVTPQTTLAPYEPQSARLFNGLSTGDYFLLSSLNNNAFCLNVQEFSIAGSEPSLSVATQPLCSPTETRPLNVSFGLNMPITQFNANLFGQSFNSSTPLSAGNYMFQVNITDPICRRILPSTSITLSTQSVEPIVTSNNCQHIDIDVLTGGVYTIIVAQTDDHSRNTTVTYDFSNVTSRLSLALDIDDNTNFTVFLQSPVCLTSSEIYIHHCAAAKKNLGWIAAVVIGAIIIAAIIAFAIYKCKRPAKVIDAGDDRIAMETVSVYTGGKINKLDKF
ncbi:hypothetical protein SAMD00019534_071750 [Acytostelium subglobosum LB1]|uniref:hypothetical protein n=1 Tax=Acytostelium subglobosum LB1 TaxID=1410327 RepID=UPI000644FCA0|nr:hypothetical protein SAMD00019534_071750 [Acytostelium subglobosum LB1]GAM24000.1 hypothetical protein SAMD00019534_071750 [Acytostelium subglobosum LB1]|eukprot:XP_012753036.1 hypothetical protein SAMD00019534_071750 [Acytostelium subglobosum LB1]